MASKSITSPKCFLEFVQYSVSLLLVECNELWYLVSQSILIISRSTSPNLCKLSNAIKGGKGFYYFYYYPPSSGISSFDKVMRLHTWHSPAREQVNYIKKISNNQFNQKLQHLLCILTSKLVLCWSKWYFSAFLTPFTVTKNCKK